MQCSEYIYRKASDKPDPRKKQEIETIHSGHFMVSHFEAEAQDDEDDVAVTVPEEEQAPAKVTVISVTANRTNSRNILDGYLNEKVQEQLSIETNLTKLFRCMTLAYRQKLTSPKWNRFKGVKLRWKDKIRLNNVIWRCWHMQFIKKRNTLVCQFASPLDVDTHIKPEATLLEGKYWKRRVEAIIAEYKKWRMFHMRLSGRVSTSSAVMSDMDTIEGFSKDDDPSAHMMIDEDYIAFMSDTLFSTISSNQPFMFPDTREIARGANLADFIQPSLGPLQPNLDDFMDTLEPLQELLSIARLPPVPEETAVTSDDIYRSNAVQPSYNQTYIDNYQLQENVNVSPTQYTQTISAGNTNQDISEMIKDQPHSPIYTANNQIIQGNTVFMPPQQQPSVYPAQQRSSFLSQNQVPRQNQVLQSQFTGQSNIIVQQQNAESMQVHPIRKQIQYTTDAKIYPQQVQNFQQIQPVVTVQSQPVAVDSNRYNNLQQRPQMVSQQTNDTYSRGRPSRTRATHYMNQPRTQQVIQNQTLQSPNVVQYGYANISPLEGAVPTSNTSSISNKLGVKSPGPINVALTPSEAAQRGRLKHFKVPSPAPPLPIVSSQHSNQTVTKDSFRSNSLPLGAQISHLVAQDWTPVTQTSVPIQPQKSRIRSRSSGGGNSNVKSGPPPLCTVLSEPSLQWDSVLLAHLLTNSQQPQSLSKLNVISGGSSSEDVQDVPSVSPAASIATPSPPSGYSYQYAANSPRSPPSPLSPMAQSYISGGGQSRDTRRAGHIHAEQKRRYNIKNGFDMLQSLIPQLSCNPNAKVSKAAMLQKGAEYIKQLKVERNQIKDEIDNLKQQIECLNNSISNCQSLLPATGAPISGSGSVTAGGVCLNRLRTSFAEHVRERTSRDHRYWVFSVLVEPLLASYGSAVAGASASGGARDMRRATLLWLERNCSLVEMRPVVLNALLTLCTKTDILSNPEKLREEALTAIDKKSVSVKNESL